jgi:hypothetical protein
MCCNPLNLEAANTKAKTAILQLPHGNSSALRHAVQLENQISIRICSRDPEQHTYAGEAVLGRQWR